jgi:hypothetical protein
MLAGVLKFLAACGWRDEALVGAVATAGRGGGEGLFIDGVLLELLSWGVLALLLVGCRRLLLRLTSVLPAC